MTPQYQCDPYGKPPKEWYRDFDRAIHFGNLELARELLQEVFIQVPYVKAQMAQGSSGEVDQGLVIKEALQHGLKPDNTGFSIPRGHRSWSPDLEDFDLTTRVWNP